jgi:iron complex transport system substrate-binding protein
MRWGRNRAALTGLIGLALVIAACGSDSSDDSSSATTQPAGAASSSPATDAATSDASESSTAGSKRTTYPLEITDCAGVTSTFTGPPQRAVTLDPQSYELMFWIGLGESQLAAGPQPLPAVPEQFQAATENVTVIAEDENDGHSQYISKETMLGANPDFVFSAYSSGFTPPSVYSEDELLAKGINAYLGFGLGGCVGEDPSAPRSDLESVFTDLLNLGKIFDVQDTTEALVADLRSQLADAVAGVDGSADAKVTALGADDTLNGTPSYWGATSTVNAIITLAGGTNVFGDMSEAYGATTFEELIARSPDVIMLIAYPADIPAGWDDVESYLTSQPALAEIPAIKNQRFVRVTFPEVGGGGVRSVDGVKKLAEVLATVAG